MVLAEESIRMPECAPSLPRDDANSKPLLLLQLPAGCLAPCLRTCWPTSCQSGRGSSWGLCWWGRVCNLTYSWSPVGRCQVGQSRCRLTRGLSEMVLWHLPLLSGSGWPQTAASLLWSRWAWRGNPVTIMQGLLVLVLLLCAGCEGVLWARITCPSGPPETEKGVWEAPCGSASQSTVCVCVGGGVSQKLPRWSTWVVGEHSPAENHPGDVSGLSENCCTTNICS